MFIKRSLLMVLALSTALFAYAAPGYAKGDVHVILVVSTTNPDTQEYAESWKQVVTEAVTAKLFSDGPHAPETTGVSPIVLEGQDAHPEKILDVCRQISEEAKAEDAIAVFVFSPAGTSSGSDNVVRHGFSPLATSDDALDLARVGVCRGSIMKALKTRKHRLILLISDSCPKSMPGEGAPPPCEAVPAIVPKRIGYLERFLTEAEGEINVNSSDYGEEPTFSSSALLLGLPGGKTLPLSHVTPLCAALYNLAINGFYLDDELNPDDFYKTLRSDMTAQQINPGETRSQQTLTSFTDDGQRVEPESQESYEKSMRDFWDNRWDTLLNSGEFEGPQP